KRYPKAEILFVGAEGRMEMEKVPLAGYPIVGLPISGLQRKITFSNFLLPFKIVLSLLKARKIIRNFKPQLLIGVGGFASGPTLKMGNLLGIPTLLQEQNSYAGKTNKILGKKASTICVAYEGMHLFFPSEKIILTGNPVRKEIVNITVSKTEALDFFKLDPSKKIVLVIGGSLGARAVNDAILNDLVKWKSLEGRVQVLWQCGKLYYESLKSKVATGGTKNIFLSEFIQRMDLAYSAADLVISRAGALSISELCMMGKASILVPSPNVAENHQMKNAMSLVVKNAAVMINDEDLTNNLFNQVERLLGNDEERLKIETNCHLLAKPLATESIIDECEKIVAKC
ncbi:MAG: undecaprenyldiphospho-muramoylpentapeptide beta-N-acetylglucosaminyltransferase, partial [Bacteroidetes bacterium]|nr:undecaprenyldiphospho-muramoylpentapeptide beta-N-acetylglucosaminyltransferase [Bacteroidota bacterium]